MDRTENAETTSLSLGVWRLADPKISLASFASVFLGTCAAVAAGHWSAGWLLLAVVPAVHAIEIAKNASGEIFDFDSGVDLAVEPHQRSPFSGGKRVLVDRILSRRQTAGIALVGYVLGTALGLSLVVGRAPQLLWVGMAGVGAAFFYHAPPLKLAYRGLGELAVAVCYGPLICLGTYLAMVGDFSRDPILLGLPLGLLIANFLLINEFPDVDADRLSGKKTLVVRSGRVAASRIFVLTTGLAFVVAGLLPWFGLTRWVWMGGVAAVPGGLAVCNILRHREDTRRLIRGQALSLATFALYSVGSGTGLLVA